MNPQVERLAKEFSKFNKDQWDVYILQAENLINAGWIHKDEAIQYVEVCPTCKGAHYDYTIDRGTYFCENCQGRGVVKEENNDGN